jgi:hypothetical protein
MPKLEPRRTRNVEGQTYRESYSFDRIAVEDIDETVAPTDGELTQLGSSNKWVYKYAGKPSVLIQEDGIYEYSDGGTESEKEKQAYFVVSVLDSAGLVEGLKKS